MRIIQNLLFILFLTTIFTTASFAQTTTQTTNDDLQKRIVQMEEQMKMMREEIEKLKKESASNQAKIATVETNQAVAKTETKVETAPATALAVTTPTATATTAKPAAAPQKQIGIDVGSAKIIPYGTIYFNAFSNSGGTNNADIPLFATPTGSGNTSASIRQTRLGLRLEGAKVGRANLKAIVEADFYGGFPSVGIGENFGVVRVRLANARLEWEKTAVTVGQDWMVFAPVSPTSIAAGAIPQMAAAGNPWARLPQVKVEHKLGKNVTFAGAVLAPQTGDFATNAPFLMQPNSGASSRVPYFQGRIAFADGNWFGTKKAGSIGFSGHYGRSRVFTGTASNIKNDIDSTGVALDWNFPLAERVSWSGEAFLGKNLGGFQAGVFQSYTPDAAYLNGTVLTARGVRSIGTRGGWTQIGFTPDGFSNKLGLYGSFGIDDPRNEDLVSISRRDLRTRNLSFAFDAIYKFTPQFQIGAEFRRLQTNYVFSGRRNANHINLGAAYTF